MRNHYTALQGIEQRAVVDQAREDARAASVPLLVFVVDALSRDEVGICAEDDFVRMAIQRATTSLVYPYSYISEEEEEEKLPLVAGSSGHIVVEKKDLEGGRWREKIGDLGGNDEVIVDLGGGFSRENSEWIRRVCEAVGKEEEGEEGAYVAVLMGRKLDGVDAGFVEEGRNRVLQATNVTLPIRSNPAMISSLLLTLFLLFFLILSLLCVDCVQGPSVFAQTYPAKGKVYA